MIIEPEFTPIVGNGDLALKKATLSNNESLKKIKSENKNKAVFPVKDVPAHAFFLTGKILKKPTLF